MAKGKSFNATVAARTRAAAQILATPELLERYAGLGGLADDLTNIVEQGQSAERLHRDQGAAEAGGVAATRVVQEAFAALKREHHAVMNVLSAVCAELELAGEKVALAKVKKILANEAATGTNGAKRTTKKNSQEAVRAEIGRDAKLLLEFAELEPLLAERRVDRPRLEQLRNDADGLSGKLATRVASVGARKAATAREQEAVRMQSVYWSATWRLLASLGQQDARVVALLADAVR